MMMHAGFGGYSMFVWMFIQWGLLLGGIYLIIRWVTKGSQRPPYQEEDHAIRILRERYARGEISEEEFDRMMERLKKGSS